MPLTRKTIPPKDASKHPYIIDNLSGEILTIPGSKTVYRILTPSLQSTENTMAVFSSAGVLADAPGFHHHETAHDVFMVTKGFLKLWVGDKCKILGPGDFAYVPPGVVHNPQLLQPYTETFGFVCPAEWIDFFRYIGEAWDGVLIPEEDERNLKGQIIGKIMAAKGRFDVHFHPHHVGAEVSEMSEGDERLPDGCEPFYLKANTGPRWLLGGVLSRPFVTTRQTGGKFAVSSIESSAVYEHSIFDQLLEFEKVSHCLCVQEGRIQLFLGDGESETVVAGESAFVPAGTAFSLRFKTKSVRIWSFASGEGIEEVVRQAGEPYQGWVIPQKAADLDQKRLDRVLGKIRVLRAPA